MGNLSDYLKTHPRTKDLSTREFGRLVGIAASSAGEILNGNAVPEERTLRKIADAFPDVPLRELQEKALLDIPFELQEEARLLNLKERAWIRSAVDQLLESSGKADRMRQAEPEQRDEGALVVELPVPNRVAKAAYNPPDERS